MTTAEAVRFRQRLEFLTPEAAEGYLSLAGYELWPKHREILFDDHLECLLMGGFRFGKSTTAAAKAGLLTLAFLGRHGAEAAGKVAWLVGQDYERTRREFEELHGFLQKWLPPHGGKRLVTSSKRIDPGWIEIKVPGGVFTVKTKSAADPNTLGAEAPVWCVVCEAAHVSFDVYDRLHSRMSESRNRFPGFGMLMLEGTLESTGKQQGVFSWYASLWTQWQNPDMQEKWNAKSFSGASHENLTIYPGGEDDPEIIYLRATKSEEDYAEQHLGIPVPPKNRVFPTADVATHVKDVEFDPELPVYLGVDPGWSGKSSTYVVLAFQRHVLSEEPHQEQWRCIDEIAVNQRTPGMESFTTVDICRLAMNRDWWRNVTFGVIDPAGKTHAGAQEPNTETWLRETRLVLRHQPTKVMAGVQRFKLMLQRNPTSLEPNFVMSPRCKLFGSELGFWNNPFDGMPHVYRYPEDSEGNVISGEPSKDYCDAVKAAWYLWVYVLGHAEANPARKQIGVKRKRRRAA